MILEGHGSAKTNWNTSSCNVAEKLIFVTNNCAYNFCSEMEKRGNPLQFSNK